MLLFQNFKKTFRKMALKYFALDYRVKILGGQSLTYTRAANVIFPLMMGMGISEVHFNGVGLNILLPLTVLVSLIPFGYLMVFPITLQDVRNGYLDKVQLYTLRLWNLTQDQTEKKEYVIGTIGQRNETFNSWFVVLWNIMWIVLFFVLFLFT